MSQILSTTQSSYTDLQDIRATSHQSSDPKAPVKDELSAFKALEKAIHKLEAKGISESELPSLLKNYENSSTKIKKFFPELFQYLHEYKAARKEYDLSISAAVNKYFENHPSYESAHPLLNRVSRELTTWDWCWSLIGVKTDHFRMLEFSSREFVPFNLSERGFLEHELAHLDTPLIQAFNSLGVARNAVVINDVISGVLPRKDHDQFLQIATTLQSYEDGVDIEIPRDLETSAFALFKKVARKYFISLEKSITSIEDFKTWLATPSSDLMYRIKLPNKDGGPTQFGTKKGYDLQHRMRRVKVIRDFISGLNGLKRSGSTRLEGRTKMAKRPNACERIVSFISGIFVPGRNKLFPKDGKLIGAVKTIPLTHSEREERAGFEQEKFLIDRDGLPKPLKPSIGYEKNRAADRVLKDEGELVIDERTPVVKGYGMPKKGMLKNKGS